MGSQPAFKMSFLALAYAMPCLIGTVFGGCGFAAQAGNTKTPAKHKANRFFIFIAPKRHYAGSQPA